MGGGLRWVVEERWRGREEGMGMGRAGQDSPVKEHLRQLVAPRVPGGGVHLAEVVKLLRLQGADSRRRGEWLSGDTPYGIPMYRQSE